MLVIRLKRVGRKGNAQYRVIVQDKRFSPKSGKIVENLGSYDPHSKKADLDLDAAKKYIKNGAHPSERVYKILKAEKVSMPSWVIKPLKKNKKTKNTEKVLRKDQPAEEEKTEAPAEETPADEAAEEKPAEEVKEAESTDEKAEEKA